MNVSIDGDTKLVLSAQSLIVVVEALKDRQYREVEALLADIQRQIMEQHASK